GLTGRVAATWWSTALERLRCPAERKAAQARHSVNISALCCAPREGHHDNTSASRLTPAKARPSVLAPGGRARPGGRRSRAAAPARERVQVIGDLHVPQLPVPTVRVPTRVAHIVVPIAAHVVEVVPQQARRDAPDARVIDQRAQPFVQIDELRDTRTRRALM